MTAAAAVTIPELENDDEADEAVDEEEKGVRRRFGAHTIDRFRAVIPVSATRSLIRFK